ncbi:LPXTG cell wall anchor domain-containing protein [Actinoplanes sp. NPDC051861]|uniref:LPXTG cell wall anchor domain-containing protein n=1 Tax=Actinoplanes sp. NPDC051861 TaxID=3155170 RepID=UPI0034474D93
MMKTVARAALGLCLAGLVSGLAGGPAYADEPTQSALDALTELDANGKIKVDSLKPGEVSTSVLGVGNTTAEALPGAVVHIRALDDADLLRRFENCAYYVDSNLDGAWCEFDAPLAARTTYAFSESTIAASSKPTWEEELGSINYFWHTKAAVEKMGGIDAAAKKSNAAGEATRGTGGKVTLVPHQLTFREKAHPLGFLYLKVQKPTASPTVTPSATASATPSATSTSSAPAATPTSDGGDGGGLPVTGSSTGLVAGIGAALLAVGAVGFVLARRRRTRFTA